MVLITQRANYVSNYAFTNTIVTIVTYLIKASIDAVSRNLWSFSTHNAVTLIGNSPAREE